MFVILDVVDFYGGNQFIEILMNVENISHIERTSRVHQDNYTRNRLYNIEQKRIAQEEGKDHSHIIVSSVEILPTHGAAVHIKNQGTGFLQSYFTVTPYKDIKALLEEKGILSCLTSNSQNESI